jgi:hypothetical protein
LYSIREEKGLREGGKAALDPKAPLFVMQKEKRTEPTASLDDGLERVSSVLSHESEIGVTLNITDGRTLHITVGRDDMIHEAVVRCLECEADDLMYVQLGDDAVGKDESFEDAGIADGARLGVCVDEMTAEEALERWWPWAPALTTA